MNITKIWLFGIFLEREALGISTRLCSNGYTKLLVHIGRCCMAQAELPELQSLTKPYVKTALFYSDK